MSPQTPSSRRQVPAVQAATERGLEALQRFLHIEAVSGGVLLAAAVAALILANSPLGESYHHFWYQPVFFGIGALSVSQSLHFWINDGLMTVFFTVVGMEIRRELHEGSLSVMRQAILPVTAAAGGVLAPALIYLTFNSDPGRTNGWAVPTATDIAFAVGVLALLGRGIPANVRIFLLALVIIDDVIAVLIIAFFYSGGLHPAGFLVAGIGILAVLALQRIGVGAALPYVLPGVLIWAGFLMTGAHPTLAGVVLGMMTPVRPRPMREDPVDVVTHVATELRNNGAVAAKDKRTLARPLRQLSLANREILPPVVRVEAALHPWVSFGIMPLFAFANAGVGFGGVDLGALGPQRVMLGVTLALVIGKPLGIVGVTWLMVRLRLGRLPEGVTWGGILLIGLLGGIGFTMSTFIAMLGFTDEGLLSAAKLGVLAGSLTAALIGIGWGALHTRRLSRSRSHQ